MQEDPGASQDLAPAWLQPNQDLRTQGNPTETASSGNWNPKPFLFRILCKKPNPEHCFDQDLQLELVPHRQRLYNRNTVPAAAGARKTQGEGLEDSKMDPEP